MRRIRFRPFWSYDVLKTQQWLNRLSVSGYHLVKMNAAFRLFHFVKKNEVTRNHMIIKDKGNKSIYKNSTEWRLICRTKNYYVFDKIANNPSWSPTYNELLRFNQKLKYIVGNILLVEVFVFVIPIFYLLVGLMIGGFKDTSFTVVDVGPLTPKETVEVILGTIRLIVLIIGHVWMIYTFFKLKVTNRNLEEICGESIDLSFTVPKDTILSKEKIKQLKIQGRYVRKFRFGWNYSPDKTEQWLIEMEGNGFNLVRMGKLGHSFYFIRSKPRKMIYHIDYQKRKSPTYFSMNEESGWKVYFTSVTRYYSISVFGQEYDDIEPEYYNDVENKVKHAKSYMLMYLVPLLSLGIMYFVIFGISLVAFTKVNLSIQNTWTLITPFLMLLAGILFLSYSFRLIKYYYRVQKDS